VLIGSEDFVQRGNHNDPASDSKQPPRKTDEKAKEYQYDCVDRFAPNYCESTSAATGFVGECCIRLAGSIRRVTGEKLRALSIPGEVFL